MHPVGQNWIDIGRVTPGDKTCWVSNGNVGEVILKNELVNVKFKIVTVTNPVFWILKVDELQHPSPTFPKLYAPFDIVNGIGRGLKSKENVLFVGEGFCVITRKCSGTANRSWIT